MLSSVFPLLILVMLVSRLQSYGFITDRRLVVSLLIEGYCQSGYCQGGYCQGGWVEPRPNPWQLWVVWVVWVG